MNINIKAVKFHASEQLESFINEKVSKLDKHVPDCLGAEVTLKVDKPSTENNKIVDIKLIIKGGDLFASKQVNSFEEGVLECTDAIKAQIEKYKEKR